MMCSQRRNCAAHDCQCSAGVANDWSSRVGGRGRGRSGAAADGGPPAESRFRGQCRHSRELIRLLLGRDP